MRTRTFTTIGVGLSITALFAVATGAQASDVTELGAPAVDRVSARVFGSYDIAETSAAIFLNAVQRSGASARGTFRHTLVFEGLLIDFIGDVSCLAVDTEEGRAWVGGIVTSNNSDHPDFILERNQPGKDIWFRVLDTGPGSPDVDRTTFLGFEGDGDIITSDEYCQEQIWPGPPDDEPNARTNPMLEGRITVRSSS